MIEQKTKAAIILNYDNKNWEFAYLDEKRRVIFESPEIFLKTYKEIKRRIKKYLKENKV